MRNASQLRWLCAPIGAAAVLTLCTLPASAMDCSGPGAIMQYCKRCTATSERRTKRDTPCSGGWVTGPSEAVLGATVTRQAQHGRIQVNGAAWTYTPSKGYVGRDVMTLEWDVVRREQAYVMFSEIHMTIE